MKRKQFLAGMFAVGCAIAFCSIVQSVATAQSDKVMTSMSALKAKAAKLGAPKIEGKDMVAGKEVPALYFGATKMNNNFAVVDEVVKENGGTATFFVKDGENFIRIATNVKKDDGSRAIGTMLDPNGPVIGKIKDRMAYYGEANILGKPYVTGYEPIKGADNEILGIYYVGYMKQ
ncbi:Cache 3/Cache 2 fusion domain-containing protein [Rhodoblastus sp.]|uniref:Cache 3/Cache 2 fusion domain-containing protein n=1 Tax=Rhodoblastus sp. TaxID=1962975 RepID=UPI0035B04789